jgi:hypothetical protein
VLQHSEQHASGINSKRSSVADGGELRSTTSGQLRAATEHSIMSIVGIMLGIFQEDLLYHPGNRG